MKVRVDDKEDNLNSSMIMSEYSKISHPFANGLVFANTETLFDPVVKSDSHLSIAGPILKKYELDEGISELQVILKSIRTELVEEFEGKENIENVNLETLFGNYLQRFFNQGRDLNESTLGYEAISESVFQPENPYVTPAYSEECTQPMKGWNFGEQLNDWVDSRSCLFCTDNTENDLLGRLIPFSDGAVTHVNCLLWCSEVTLAGAQLVNAEAARKRCSVQTCYFCLKRGATVNCCRSYRKCKRAYHIGCAVTSKCLLLEKNPSVLKNFENSVDSQDEPLFEAFCPEHIQEADTLFSTGNPIKLQTFINWKPYDPLKCLVTETCVPKVEIENVAAVLAQGRTDVAVKSGAITILKIGKPLLDKTGFSTTSYIYPHHFMSCRIFWSMKTSFTRTVYLFDILDKSDLEGWDTTQISYLQRSIRELENKYPTRSPQINPTEIRTIESDNDLLFGAIFRVVPLDSLDFPIFAKSVTQLHSYILERVYSCFEGFYQTIGHKKRQSSHSYNLTPHQFFGLGLPFVQEAIEMIPESIITMITTNEKERYSPYYRLPSQLDVQNIIKYQSNLHSKFMNTSSINGAAKADPYQERILHDNISVRISKTKTVGQDPTEGSIVDSTDDTKREDEYLVDINKESSKAEMESRKLRFLDMTKAYIRNPHAKLEVKKSRIHGWGLFSKINYEKDDVIIEYIGEKVRQIIADYREINYENEGVGSCYLFRYFL